MDTNRYRPLAAICIVAILACQTWSAAAYMNQQTKWLKEHLSLPKFERVVSRPARHLQESKTTGRHGYRATLVDEDHQLHTILGLSDAERIFRASERSWSRAYALDSKARAAPYFKGPSPAGTGRKLLQVPGAPESFESSIEATPGGYSMAFSIGTPPQDFVAIADTGSDLVWLQCADCTVCFPQTTPLFQPGNSSTYAALGCSNACNQLGSNALQCSPTCLYSYAYGDQSKTSGDYSSDTVILEDADATTTTLIPNFNFGCGLQNKGTFTNVDGLVGLGRGPISFPSQIAPYLNNKTVFSYCLVSANSNSNSTVTSPIIFGEDAMPTNSSFVYTPLLTPYNVSEVPYYYVNLQGITVGNVNLSIPASAFQTDASGNGGTIFDSGTTYTTLVSAAYKPLLAEIENQITAYPVVDLFQSTGLDLCYDISGQTTVEIPDIVFHFENADFDLPFDNIMVLFADRQSEYMCVAMMSSPGMTIFGNTQQQNYQIVFEVDALQIGWNPADCSTL